MFSLERLENETQFEHKLRLVKAKLSHVIDADWSELVEVLGLDVTPDHLRKTAYGIMEYDNYLTSKDREGNTTILCLSDLHVPYQLDYSAYLGDYRNVDYLVLNGDICDMQAISKFPKSYRNSPMDEIVEARNYLIDLIKFINPKLVLITYGNHDLRFQSYLARNLDSDLLELMPETPLELMCTYGFHRFDKKTGTKTEYEAISKVLKPLGIEVVYTSKWHCRIGQTIFCHPSAFSSGILKTAEKAMVYFKNAGEVFDTLVMAHTHRMGSYIAGTTNIYEQGAFCDVDKMQYTDGKLINSQVKGFIYLVQDSEGNAIPSKTKLVTL